MVLRKELWSTPVCDHRSYFGADLYISIATLISHQLRDQHPLSRCLLYNTFRVV